jgi:UPF0042 nucleotide-binding protein
MNLRSKTGMEQEVKDYIFESGQAEEFMGKLFDLLDFILPLYVKEGKTSLVISIGCTGGKHRSVAMAEELYTYLKAHDYHANLTHRDYQRI